MNQSWLTTSVKQHPLRGRKLPRRLRMAVAILALPLGLVSLLPKSAVATAPTRRLNAQHDTVVVAQPQGPRAHHEQERAAARREVIRYEEARRAAQQKRWVSAFGNGVPQEAMTP